MRKSAGTWRFPCTPSKHFWGRLWGGSAALLDLSWDHDVQKKEDLQVSPWVQNRRAKRARSSAPLWSSPRWAHPRAGKPLYWYWCSGVCLFDSIHPLLLHRSSVQILETTSRPRPLAPVPVGRGGAREGPWRKHDVAMSRGDHPVASVPW